jgi:hypothetical protein
MEIAFTVALFVVAAGVVVYFKRRRAAKKNGGGVPNWSEPKNPKDNQP